MGMNEAAVLKTLDGEVMPLVGVSAKGVLAGALFEMTVEQRYRNEREANIEAVYTFPLVPDAVLLGIEFELNGKKLAGVAVEKSSGERQYEEVLESGDSAILLEKSGDGLYTVNLGNLMPGEESVVRYRYAEPLRWEQGRVRLTIPTTIAPRYGNSAADGLLPHLQPSSDVVVSYPFALSIDVLGDLAKGTLASPSHALATTLTEAGLRVELRQGWLDRDVVLELTGTSDSVVYVAPDGEGWAAMAAFCPALPELDVQGALSLRLVIDCSGSMGGDSIVSARHGALKVVESLQPGDAFDITRFGSEFHHLFKRLKAVGNKSIVQAARLLTALEADLGGTEMESALAAVAALPGEHAGGAVLLITDGEVWGVDPLIATAKASGLNYFVVGVGSAPSHSTLRRLAEATGGNYEAVTPGENIEAAIVRQFKRMRQPRATHLRLIWPGQPAWCLPVPNALFQGDTLHAFAGFDEIPEGSVRLLYDLDDGTTQEARAVLQTWPGTPETLARLAVAKRLVQAEEEEGETSLSDTTRTELAVRYNLVSDLTHYLVVHERAEGEKAEDLPEVAKVLQMQAAGWGGTSTVLACMSGVAGAGTDQIRYSKRRSSSAVDFDMPTMMRNRRVSEAPPALRMSHHRRSIASGRTTMRSFLGDILSSFGNNQSISGTATAFLQKLDQRLASRLRGRLPNRLETLSRLGLDQTIVNALAALAQTEGLSEAEVIVVFLSVMDCNGWLSSLCRASRMRLDDAVGLQMMNSHHHELVQQILVGTDFERELASTAASDDGLESLTIPEFLRKQAE